jgi:hypothetical protein
VKSAGLDERERASRTLQLVDGANREVRAKIDEVLGPLYVVT